MWLSAPNLGDQMFINHPSRPIVVTRLAHEKFPFPTAIRLLPWHRFFFNIYACIFLFMFSSCLIAISFVYCLLLIVECIILELSSRKQIIFQWKCIKEFQIVIITKSTMNRCKLNWIDESSQWFKKKKKIHLLVIKNKNEKKFHFTVNYLYFLFFHS